MAESVDPRRYAEDNRKKIIVRIGKSKTQVTIIEDCAQGTSSTVLLELTTVNYWQTRSIARPLCDSRASCYHCHVLDSSYAKSTWRPVLWFLYQQVLAAKLRYYDPNRFIPPIRQQSSISDELLPNAKNACQPRRTQLHTCTSRKPDLPLCRCTCCEN